MDANKVLQMYRTLWAGCDVHVPSAESQALVLLAAAVAVSAQEVCTALKQKQADDIDF